MQIKVGDALLSPVVRDGWLQSIGPVQVGTTSLRNPAVRFLPWFATYAGDVFRQFKYLNTQRRGDQTVLRTIAVSDPDVLFRKRRDVSGDLCFRETSWDAPALETQLDIVFEPVQTTITGQATATLAADRAYRITAVGRPRTP